MGLKIHHRIKKNKLELAEIVESMYGWKNVCCSITPVRRTDEDVIWLRDRLYS